MTIELKRSYYVGEKKKKPEKFIPNTHTHTSKRSQSCDKKKKKRPNVDNPAVCPTNEHVKVNIFSKDQRYAGFLKKYIFSFLSDPRLPTSCGESIHPDGPVRVQRERQPEEESGAAQRQHGAARRHAAGRKRPPQRSAHTRKSCTK